MAVAPLPTAEKVSVSVGDYNQGSIIVGDNNCLINNSPGAVYQKIELSDTRPRRLPRSPYRLPKNRRFRLLDRQIEFPTAKNDLQNEQSVKITGSSGIGKSMLLHHLAQAVHNQFPDGVIHLSAREMAVDEIREYIFDQLYEDPQLRKRKPGELNRYLQNIQALILLDDVTLEPSELEQLVDHTLLDSTWLTASEASRGWTDWEMIALSGLPASDALGLVARAIKRSLAEEERSPATAICEALKGHPESILQTARLVITENRSLEDIVQELGADSSDKKLAAMLFAPLAGFERELVQALAAFDGESLNVEHLGVIADLSDPLPVLRTLFERQLIANDGFRVSLVGPLRKVLQETADLNPWLKRSLSHFIAWAEQNQGEPDKLRAETNTFLRLLNWAVREKDWARALRLARAIENALITGKRWEAWLKVLRLALQAAQMSGDQMSEGWALHQLGTRALCLDESTVARETLIRALRIRQAIGDRAGAEVTRHNLSFLLGPPASSDPPPKVDPAPPTPEPASLLSRIATLPTALKVAVAILLVALPALLLTSLIPNPPAKQQPLASATSFITPGGFIVSLDLFPGSLNFSQQQLGLSSIPKSVVITNNSAANAGIRSTHLQGPNLDSFFITSDACSGATLSPGGSCIVSVAFEPRTQGNFSGNLIINDARSASPLTVPLFGAGFIPTATPSPTPTPTITPSPTNTAPPTGTATPITPTPITPSPTPITPSPTPITPTPTTPAPLPSVAFAETTFRFGEDQEAAIITVALNTATDKTVTVNYSTTGGTAASGSDYLDVNGTLTFAPGVTGQTFQVALINDELDEPDGETVFLSLSTPSNAILNDNPAATLTIIDDDSPPSVRLVPPTFTSLKENGSLGLEVILTRPSAQVVTVDYLSSGSAGLQDYAITTNRPLTFLPGETSKFITLQIVEDILDEEDETITLDLSTPSNAISDGDPVTLTILDNDEPPYIIFRVASGGYTAFENEGDVPIEVILTAPSGREVKIDYAVIDGDGPVPNEDFIPAQGTLTFNPGETQKSFMVTLVDDSLLEGNRELLALRLRNPQNALFPPGVTDEQLTFLTIFDDEENQTAVIIAFSPRTLAYVVEEGEGTIQFEILMRTDRPITLTYSTQAGGRTVDLPPATAGEDYGTANDVLSFAPGNTIQAFTINILPDEIPEDFESFTIELRSPALLESSADIPVIIFEHGATLPQSPAAR